MSWETCCSGRPSGLAETRTSRCRSLRRTVEGPVPVSVRTTSRSGTWTLSWLASSRSEGTVSCSRSSAKRRWSARSRTRTSWLSPCSSSITLGTSPATAALSVVAIGPAVRPRSPARSRLTRTASSGLDFSRLDSMSATPGTRRSPACSSRESRSSSPMSWPRTLIWIGFWPKGPTTVRPKVTPGTPSMAWRARRRASEKVWPLVERSLT